MPTRQRQSPFRVGLTADFFTSDGYSKYRDMGLSVLDECPEKIAYHRLSEFESQITAEQVEDADGLIVLTPSVTAESVANAERLLAIGRFGVGYDAVNVAACTAADVAVFITAGAVNRSVAEATVGWMLALSHQTRIKDQLVRTCRWDDRSQYMGSELRDRTFGTIGFGGIAQATIELLRGFGMAPPLVYDPFVEDAAVRQAGAKPVNLRELLAGADFVSIHCPLTSETRGLIGARELALMKPKAYLLNTARGGIVDELALATALAKKQIAGAAIDCFQTEPVREPHPLSKFDNVLLAPHCIAWTDELFRDIGQMVCRGMIDLADGRKPAGVVNPEVFERPGFLQKWERANESAHQRVLSR